MANREKKTTLPKSSDKFNLFSFMKAKRWPIILLVIVLIVGVVSASLTVAYREVMDSSILVDNSGNTEDDDGVLDDDIATRPEEQAQYMNVLLCGIDYKENTSRGKLTDVMMIIHMDFVNGTVDILQMPRDTYIGRDYSTGKLNAIYGSSQNGGIENLARRLNTMLKISLDYYIMLDMDGFEDIVDAIGGVTVDSPYAFTLEGVTITKGVQTLNGREASKFVRERHTYAAGDLTRMKMQQIFLKAFVQKCLSLGKSEMLKLAPKVFEYLTTDMSLNKALSLYQNFSGMGLEDMQFHSCEVTSFTDSYDSLSKLSIHVKPLADTLNTYFRENGEKIAWTELEIYEYDTRYSYEGEQNEYVRDPNSPYIYSPSRKNNTTSQSSSGTVTQESSSDTSSETTSETSSASSTGTSSETSSQTSSAASSQTTTSETSSETSSEISSATSSHTSSETSAETSSETSSATSSQTSSDASSEASSASSSQASSDTSSQASAQTSSSSVSSDTSSQASSVVESQSGSETSSAVESSSAAPVSDDPEQFEWEDAA